VAPAPASAASEQWPADMSAEAPRDGVRKNDDGLGWGADPSEVATPKKV
jgi:hypothetical protein